MSQDRQSMTNPIHLGDGAYATLDDGGAVLTANHHDPEQASDRVYLDRHAIWTLKNWLELAIDANSQKD